MVFAEGDVDKKLDEKSKLFEQIDDCFKRERSLTKELDLSKILIGIINPIIIKKKENESN